LTGEFDADESWKLVYAVANWLPGGASLKPAAKVTAWYPFGKQ
jgi:hypothetical protein